MIYRSNMAPISIIVAVDEAGGFAKDGKIPWNFKKDMVHFKEKTKGNVCVMGRKTYEDMLEMRKSRKPDEDITKITEILPGRSSFVVTRNPQSTVFGATAVSSLREAIQSLEESDKRTVFVIGGYRLFVEAIVWTNEIHMTIIKGTHGCDKFFPMAGIKDKFTITFGESNEDLHFVTYQRFRS